MDPRGSTDDSGDTWENVWTTIKPDGGRDETQGAIKHAYTPATLNRVHGANANANLRTNSQLMSGSISSAGRRKSENVENRRSRETKNTGSRGATNVSEADVRNLSCVGGLTQQEVEFHSAQY